MQESRWLRLVAPGLIAITVAAWLGSSAAPAVARPWNPQTCAAGAAPPSAARSSPIALADVGSQAWYRLDPLLDRAGALAGQRLSFGLDRERQARFLDLPAESFAAGPFGRSILVGADDGVSSRLRLLDVPNDCFVDIGGNDDVIRRATIDADGTRLYEMRVDRRTRADLGIWLRSLAGDTEPVQVLPPIADDERFGRTFSTELSWSLDGSRLAVQSCGELACRTRVVDSASGSVATLDQPGFGTLVGIEGDTLVSYAACRGLPCPIVAVDLERGSITTVTDAAVAAVLVATTSGPRVVHEQFSGPAVGLRATTLDGSSALELGMLEEDLRLVPSAGMAGAATVVPEGWVTLAPDGRLPAADPVTRLHLRQAIDGQAVQLEEIVR